jgi:hypothetical protein
MRKFLTKVHMLQHFLLGQLEGPPNNVQGKPRYMLVLFRQSLASAAGLLDFLFTKLNHLVEMMLGSMDDLGICRHGYVSRRVGSV